MPGPQTWGELWVSSLLGCAVPTSDVVPMTQLLTVPMASAGRRAFAKLEHACPELLDAAMRHVMRLTHEYTPQSDANMLWCEPGPA